ncbi:MAG: DUF1800 family protein [Rubripirellula sp.]
MTSLRVTSFRLGSVLVCLGVVFTGLTPINRAEGGTFEATDATDAIRIQAQIRAAHFLSKASFGAKQEDLEIGNPSNPSSLANRIYQIGYRNACTEWIDHQFAIVDDFNSARSNSATPAYFVRSHLGTIFDMLEADGIFYDSESGHPAGTINTTAGVSITRYRRYAWWDNALRGEDQLRQRFAWALSQIFVIGPSAFGNTSEDWTGFGAWLGATRYYDEVLLDNAFGSRVAGNESYENYRQLLSNMTFSPLMGYYLSHFGNRKASITSQRYPDENYAREIMQLFSIGLQELELDGRAKATPDGELIPTYNNDDIQALARLFTGFVANKDPDDLDDPIKGGRVNRNYNRPMWIKASDHDNNRNYSEDPNNPGQPDPNAVQEKRFLGSALTSIPESPTSDDVIAEIEQGLDIIANHPNVAPFICEQLIKRMVKSNPSRAYVRRVANKFNDDGDGNRGNFRAVLKAILLDPELSRGQRVSRRRSPDRVEVSSRGSEHSRLKEPVVAIASMIRALDPTPNSDTDETMVLGGTLSNFGQEPYAAPSVFNFYLPSFQPPGSIIDYRPSRRIPSGSLVAPEFQILDAVTANKSVNQIISWIRNGRVTTSYTNNGYDLRYQIDFDLDDERALIADLDNAPQLLQEVDLRLCSGSLSESSKAVIIDALTTSTTRNTDIRLDEVLIGVLTSPDFMVEQ